VAGKRRRVIACCGDRALDDLGHRVGVERPRADAAPSADGAKQRLVALVVLVIVVIVPGLFARDAARVHPGLERAHGAGVGVGAAGQRHAAAGALLVGFGAANAHRDAFLGPGKIAHRERGQLAPPQSPGVAGQQQRAVPSPERAGRQVGENLLHVRGDERAAHGLHDTVDPADPLHRLRDLGMLEGSRGGKPGRAVHLRDGGQAPLQRGRFVARGMIGKVERDCLGRCRQGDAPPGPAPRLEMPPVRLVSA
jgi:hypothetical protein